MAWSAPSLYRRTLSGPNPGDEPRELIGGMPLCTESTSARPPTHVVGTDAKGKPIQRTKFPRSTIFASFANAPAALIGMEACPGSQWLARQFTALGHVVRIIPAKFVRPCLKSNKNNTLDAQPCDSCRSGTANRSTCRHCTAYAINSYTAVLA